MHMSRLCIYRAISLKFGSVKTKCDQIAMTHMAWFEFLLGAMLLGVYD
jgi:hypothetical protein